MAEEKMALAVGGVACVVQEWLHRGWVELVGSFLQSRGIERIGQDHIADLRGEVRLTEQRAGSNVTTAKRSQANPIDGARRNPVFFQSREGGRNEIVEVKFL